MVSNLCMGHNQALHMGSQAPYMDSQAPHMDSQAPHMDSQVILYIGHWWQWYNSNNSALV